MKLCNVSYKDEETQQERICQGDATGPRPAARAGFGLRVCQACWPGVNALLATKYGRGSGFAFVAVEGKTDV